MKICSKNLQGNNHQGRIMAKGCTCHRPWGARGNITMQQTIASYMHAYKREWPHWQTMQVLWAYNQLSPMLCWHVVDPSLPRRHTPQGAPKRIVPGFMDKSGTTPMESPLATITLQVIHGIGCYFQGDLLITDKATW